MIKRLHGSDLTINLETKRSGYWPPPPGRRAALFTANIPAILSKTGPKRSEDLTGARP